MLIARSRPGAFGAVAFVLALAAPLQAQVPDKFTNLQILPKEIAKPELITTMRGWAGDLGVRCAYCHVGPDNLQGMDFASDAKRSKRVAREMYKMLGNIALTINTLPTGDTPAQPVGCYTCHRGLAQPAGDIRKLMIQKVDSEGIASALKLYRDLRQDHFAKGHYDFSENSLNSVANQLIEAEHVDAARAALELNLEYYPQVASVHAVAGRVHLAAGAKDKARAEFKKALELDPNERTARFELDRLDAVPKTP